MFESRAKAQEAIAAGLARVDGVPVTKPSARVSTGAVVEAGSAYPWVSRGGLKLVAGLDAFGIDPAGQICLDVGASTGGFTEVLLDRGARHVYALDVGRGQLHPRLVSDPRVTDWSETNIRTLDPGRFVSAPGILTCDVSFISLRLVLPHVLALAAPAAELVALIKPQFEVGRGGTVKGIVRDAGARAEVCRSIGKLLTDLGWAVVGTCESPITGGDGNVEYLIGARRP